LMSSTPLAYPQVVSRRLTSFRVANFSVSAAHGDFRGGFDSRQLHRLNRENSTNIGRRGRQSILAPMHRVNSKLFREKRRDKTRSCRGAIRCLDMFEEQAADLDGSRFWHHHKEGFFLSTSGMPELQRATQLPLRADGGQHLAHINSCLPMSHRADPYRVSAGQPRYMRLRFPAAPQQDS
jgi:hypothetical protein